ncbi:hypothetical protein Nepgr_004216 [Nepenthes gracilis]|uniref:Phosphoribulokinase/uridine kinase domain-containing protein n=1 Tax=Nepenthes gracilis TaxID=150966 RepID=A0AAD3S140_NEPGR|nr:hypothetical protein Nepgr_004216 [Nepenthes gracilis]
MCSVGCVFSSSSGCPFSYHATTQFHLLLQHPYFPRLQWALSSDAIDTMDMPKSKVDGDEDHNLILLVSSFPITARGHWCSSSADLLKRVKLPLWSQSYVSLVSTGRTTQPLHSEIKPHFCKDIPVKVLCSQKSEVPVLEARCMDEVYDALALRILPNAASASNHNLKHIVGLAGPPGAGKSTLASQVVRCVNKLWAQKASSLNEEIDFSDVAIVLPMDGFHLYRHQLDAMEDPKEAHARRGAPWTFDPARMLKCLQTLRSQGSVHAPSFDHSVGDPVEDDIFVTPQHKIVLIEGNYLLLEEAVWSEMSTIFDEKWFIEVDIDTAMHRVEKRHISTAGKPPNVAKWRIEYNDRPNAEMIMKSMTNADLIIRDSWPQRLRQVPVDGYLFELSVTH